MQGPYLPMASQFMTGSVWTATALPANQPLRGASQSSKKWVKWDELEAGEVTPKMVVNLRLLRQVLWYLWTFHFNWLNWLMGGEYFMKLFVILCTYRVTIWAKDSQTSHKQQTRSSAKKVKPDEIHEFVEGHLIVRHLHQKHILLGRNLSNPTYSYICYRLKSFVCYASLFSGYWLFVFSGSAMRFHPVFFYDENGQVSLWVWPWNGRGLYSSMVSNEFSFSCLSRLYFLLGILSHLAVAL